MTQRTPSQVDHPTPVTDYSFPSLDSFPPLRNDALLRSAQGTQPLALGTPPPIWIMRQAGRYLPEFQQVRRDHSFFTVCRTPALACEVTLQPIRRFDGLLDASIIFSDILVVPQAMGLEVQMLGGVGPHFPSPLVDPHDAQRRILDRECDVFHELKYVYAAITETRNGLEGKVPLIGFCAGPWTLFGYMVEGGGSRTWEKAKAWAYKNPDSAHAILDRIARVSAQYLAHQVQAGAQVRPSSPSLSLDRAHLLAGPNPHPRRARPHRSSSKCSTPTPTASPRTASTRSSSPTCASSRPSSASTSPPSPPPRPPSPARP